MPYESTKALRALGSLAYKDAGEVADSHKTMAQLLRLLQLHPCENALQLAAMKTLCHLAFSKEIARQTLSHDFIDVLMAARLAPEGSLTAEVRMSADEATARIIAAEATPGTAKRSPSTALMHIFRTEAEARARAATRLQSMLRLLDEELVDVDYLSECFIASAPSESASTAQAAAAGWLCLMVDMASQLTLSPGLRTAAVLMGTHCRSLQVQMQGVEAMVTFAAGRRGPEMVAEAGGVKQVELALALEEDAALQTSCLSFLVDVLDWPLAVQKQCEVDYARVVAMTKDAMRRHLDVVSFQVAALSGLAKIVEVLACSAEVKAGGSEGLIKAVLARHWGNQQVCTWGRILLDTLGLDRHWAGRE